MTQPGKTNPRGISATEPRRMALALLAVVLLIAGAILGHPDMGAADTCAGSYDIGCTSNAQCGTYCRSLPGVCDVDFCALVSGFCYCKLVP